ncbi:Erv1/Alr [Macleaya cordata]|uniref:Sulfhydryl oxidase n=1 Tax=Macleaya cordata TaxID=56857 RepID=A0A200R330_MACCD|nr:Erv1/Alr [Macleaya cordata]
MSQNQNPFQIVFKTYDNLAKCIQTHLSNLFPISSSSSRTTTPSEIHLTISQPNIENFPKPQSAKPVTKEELGRATWTLLHTLGAQYPDHPTKQQRKDVKELMAILCRIYPCKECADHFKEVLRVNPVQAGSQAEFSQWLCHVHNVVNRSLGKLVFPCQRVDARWGKLDCRERACDLEGTTNFDK